MPRWFLLSLILSFSCLGCQGVSPDAGTDTATTTTEALPTPEPSLAPEADLTNQFPVQSPSQQPSPQSSVQSAPTAQPDHGSQVWVNTKSGVYHYPGTRWYGDTQEGVYMSESEAQSSGYHAAANGQ